MAFLLGCFILIGGAFFAMLRWGSQVPLFNDFFSENGVPAAAPSPIVPKVPSVTLTIQKSAGGNTLTVQWENLPENTAALDIFRSTKGKNNWSLWKTIPLAAGEFGSGSIGFNIGNATFNNYSFYIEAVNNGSGNGNGNPTNGLGETILWISSSTTPVVTTSTPSAPPASNPPGETPPSTPSSSPPNPGNSPPPETGTPPTTTTPTSTPPPAPQGIPYYTPQVQISGYGSSQAGSFWVQHIDQKIEIGWQNLPSQTTSVVVLRSQNQDGPWFTVLAEENPSESYSIQIVDNTLGQTYYYELNSLAGSTTLATYGPVTLPPFIPKQ